MFWPFIFINEEKEDIPKGYLKNGNRLIKLHNPYAESPRPKTKDGDYEQYLKLKEKFEGDTQ